MSCPGRHPEVVFLCCENPDLWAKQGRYLHLRWCFPCCTPKARNRVASRGFWLRGHWDVILRRTLTVSRRTQPFTAVGEVKQWESWNWGSCYPIASVPHLSAVSLSKCQFPWAQSQSENIKWEIPEAIHKFQITLITAYCCNCLVLLSLLLVLLYA